MAHLSHSRRGMQHNFQTRIICGAASMPTSHHLKGAFTVALLPEFLNCQSYLLL